MVDMDVKDGLEAPICGRALELAGAPQIEDEDCGCIGGKGWAVGEAIGEVCRGGAAGAREGKELNF